MVLSVVVVECLLVLPLALSTVKTYSYHIQFQTCIRTTSVHTEERGASKNRPLLRMSPGGGEVLTVFEFKDFISHMLNGNVWLRDYSVLHFGTK